MAAFICFSTLAVIVGKENGVHTVFLDAAKAFDWVDHHTLLPRLAEAGLDAAAIGWFKSDLSDQNI